MRVMLYFTACVGVIFGTVSCRYRVEAFKNGNIAGGEMRSSGQALFAHLNEEHYLTLDGKTYRHVAGTAPYYLEMPEVHLILFVTGSEDRGDIKFHIFDPGTSQDRVIDGGTIHFGTDIRAPRKAGDAYTDFVLAANSNEVTLASQAPNARTIIVLNLSSNVVERVERKMIPAQ